MPNSNHQHRRSGTPRLLSAGEFARHGTKLLTANNCSDKQRHFEPPRDSYHQFQVQPEWRLQSELPAAEYFWQFPGYGRHSIEFEPVRDARAFAQLEPAPRGKHATELEPEPHADPQR